MESLFTKLFAEFTSNQFLTGGFILGAIGAMLVYLRTIPRAILQFIKRKIIINIEIKNTDDCFNWFINWISKSGYMDNSGHLLLSSRSKNNNNDDDDDDSGENLELLLSPGIGFHLFWHNRIPIWISRDEKDTSSGTSYNPKLMESFHISTFKIYKKEILNIMNAAKDTYFIKDDNNISIYTVSYDSWERSADIPKRSLESVVLDNDTVDKIVLDLQNFRNNKDFYRKKNIPYRRGYMLSGLPGTGKTSLIYALASYFNSDIYFLDLSTDKISNHDLLHLMHKIPQYSFIVMEDMDTLKAADRTANEDVLKSVNITGLLNAMDGIGSQEGKVLFVTTNHINKIDSALLRPGRIDKHIEFKNATEYQIKQMFNMFSIDGDLLRSTLGKAGSVTMADVQNILMSETVL